MPIGMKMVKSKKMMINLRNKMMNVKTINLPSELIEALKRKADQRGYTVSDLIAFVIYQHYSEANLRG